MYDAGGKLMSGIKSIYIHILAYVRVKWGEAERERFRKECSLRQGLSCPLGFSMKMKRK